MKKIEAYIRPEKLSDIKEMLNQLNVGGLSISQIMGAGNQKGWREYVRGAEVEYNFVQKLKLEIVVLDEQVNEIVDKICEKAYTGEVGDGKIFISDIIDAIRIRTRERGIDAIK
jgi:nitrogen regulatory protein P-II 1